MVPKKATHVHFPSYLNVTKATEISNLDPLTFARLLTETDRQLMDVEGRLDYRRTPMTVARVLERSFHVLSPRNVTLFRKMRMK